ncbi:MAG: SdrD B-like domain-containing protein, partial [Ilumatobacteraceae bacterium]
GDVPHPHILRRLVPWLTDPSVAVVQGMVVGQLDPGDAESVDGRHEHDLERRMLVPALGVRGAAAFSGSGALIRPAALAQVTTGDTSLPMVHAHVTTALLAAGWRIAAPGGMPLVATSPATQPDQVEHARACEASAARHLLFGHDGAVRGRGLGVDQRLALVAMSLRPLAGVRRSVVVAILCASLLSGRLPFEPSWQGMAFLWAPWILLSSLGLWLLSRGTLRPGDRLRWSMRMLGASWRGLLSPNGRLDRRQPVLSDAFGLAHGGAPAAAVAALSVVLGLRALSDRVTHTLDAMTLDQLVPLLGLSLWTLAGALDALRMLARRAQHRRAARVVSSLPSTLADRASIVVDLTPLGAGVMADADVDIGSRQLLDVVVPTASGCVSASVPVVIRNIRSDFSGERHIGVEFGVVESYVADALVEYCIVQPALEVLGGVPIDQSIADLRPVMVSDISSVGPRRLGLRAAALVAVMGAMVSAVPPRAEASTSSGENRSIDGSVVIDDGSVRPAAGALATVVCSVDRGADVQFGTMDDSFTGPASIVSGTDGTFRLPVDGDVCWWSVAPPLGTMVRGETSEAESPSNPRVVEPGESTLDPVRLVSSAPPAPAADASTTDVIDMVWFDADGDGMVGDDERGVSDVTVALVDRSGAVYTTTLSDADGRFQFLAVPDGRYRLAVSNVPPNAVPPTPSGLGPSFVVLAGTDSDLAIGLRPTAVAVAEAAETGSSQSAFPAPAVIDVAPEAGGDAGGGGGGSNLGALLVVLLAALIGLSVVLGSVNPIRLQSDSPDFAIR